MILLAEKYVAQQPQWPQTGRHILAQFDNDSVVVYQAFSPAIGQFAAQNQRFGGSFKFDRMSWIKPNFLWMMYRSGWGSKPDQEAVLAVWLRRQAFDQILSQAVGSSFEPETYASESEWKRALQLSDVRLQWDPDHDPAGRPLPRRAIQLGLRGEVLARYAHEWIIKIEDNSTLVRHQCRFSNESGLNNLTVPRERTYPVTLEIAKRLGMPRGG